MRALLDTSVLVATFLGDHEHHEASMNTFLGLGKREGYCAAQSLAEVYATLTRLPGKYRVSCEQAMLFLQEIRQRITIVALDVEEYYETIEQVSALAITGGALYDALIACCALKAKADMIYTWNVKHFQQLGQEIARRVKTP